MPVDPRFRDWLTVGFQRTLLVVARTETALSRLLDIVSLVERDPRVQVVFTTDPGNPAVFRAGLDEHLAARGARVIDWAQATSTRFDLAISASENDNLAELNAPVLLVPHGLGHQKYYPNSGIVAGMNPARLLHDGTVIPETIALSHPEQRAQLARICPPADAHAVVVGDPTLDRLLAGRLRAEAYRAALGATGKTLVTLSSTWGAESLLATDPALPERLVAELPVDEYRVALLLHSGVWSAHGPWQVRAWLSRAAELGLHLVGPTGNWQAVLSATHCLISDEGSLALYAAALDLPILLVDKTGGKTVTGSPLARLAELAPRLDPATGLAAQVDAAITGHRPGGWTQAISRAAERPGRCAEVLRPLVYRALDLSEPDGEPVMRPADLPEDAPHQVAVMVAGAIDDEPVLALRRLPGVPNHPLPHQHLVADVDRAPYGKVTAASVLLVDDGQRATALLAQYPRAEVVATRIDATSVRVATRQGRSVVRAADPPRGFDPTVLASLVFVRGRLSGSDKLRVGSRIIEVELAAS